MIIELSVYAHSDSCRNPRVSRTHLPPKRKSSVPAAQILFLRKAAVAAVAAATCRGCAARMRTTTRCQRRRLRPPGVLRANSWYKKRALAPLRRHISDPGRWRECDNCKRSLYDCWFFCCWNENGAGRWDGGGP